MKIEYATASDLGELLGFLLAVFRQSCPTHSAFDKIYPDLFLPDDAVLGRHALVRDERGIAACVGTYPMLMQAGGCRILSAGVGQVATRADAQGRGYMSALLRQELARCRDEGCAFAWLSGRRDRYARFGFEFGGLSYRYLCDAHSLRDIVRDREVSHVPATGPGAVTESMFALRGRTVNSIIEPLETYRLQLRRLGFSLEVWSAVPRGASEPDAWALVEASSRRIEEWCGSLDGRAEILRALAGEGPVERLESAADADASALLRRTCFYMAPVSCMLAVLDAPRLLAAAAPLLPPGYAPSLSALSPGDLVRSLFGPGPECPAPIPVCIPSLFHV